jgi:hypothetical protein
MKVSAAGPLFGASIVLPGRLFLNRVARGVAGAV